MNDLRAEAQRLLQDSAKAWESWKRSTDPLPTRREIAVRWSNLLSDFLGANGEELDRLGGNAEVEALGAWHDLWAEAAIGALADERLELRQGVGATLRWLFGKAKTTISDIGGTAFTGVAVGAGLGLILLLLRKK